MIRTLWVTFAAVFATLTFGSLAIMYGYVGFPKGVRNWGMRRWTRMVLKAAASSVTVHGLENIDESGPQIITANHQSMFDVFALAACLPVRYHFVAKRELSRIPVFGRAAAGAGNIYIDRGDRASAIESLKRAGRRIREENSTAITYPEGTRSLTGDLQKFKKGPFVMAIEAGVPIVPTVVDGVFDILPKRGLRVRPHPITVRFGEPIDTRVYRREAREDRDALMLRVHAVMAEMLAELRAPEGYSGPRRLSVRPAPVGGES